MPTNELFLAVQPLIHINSGLTEQVLTLQPSRDFATQFSPDEVAGYVTMFVNRANLYLTGGSVIGYRHLLETLANGRIIVKVYQDVR